MEEFVRYEDEEGVTITGQAVIVKEKRFSLRELSEIRLKRIPPSRMPSFLFFMIGVFALFIGSVEFASWIDSGWRGYMQSLDTQTYYLAAGVVFILTAIVIMVFQQDRFSIIARVRGKKKELLETGNRDYAANVAVAIKAAHSRYVPAG